MVGGMNDMVMDFSMFNPWELINTMDQLKQTDPQLANQIGMGLDQMGLTRDVVTNAMATGAPLPISPRQLYPEGPAPAAMPVNGLDMPAPPPVPRPAPGGTGEATAPDMTSAAPSFTPPLSLGGLSMPTTAPITGTEPAPAAGGGQVYNQPPAPSGAPDARTQAQRAMAANQGFKAPQEQKPQIQDIRQAPPPPKQGDIKAGSAALQMLLQAALAGGGGAQNPLRVPSLGSLVGKR